MITTVKNLKTFLFLPLVILTLVLSCQSDETEIINPPIEEVIGVNSVIANFISHTTLNDGSIDNIIDYANCLEVVLPVTVVANGETFSIQSIADYDTLETNLDANTNDSDQVVITFPITVILNDYTALVINSQAELDSQTALCNGENEEDDDIECIDFQYPVSISTYDSNFQTTNTIVFQNDEALYGFVANLNAGIIASFNFPITMVLIDNTTIVVNSNQELTDAIAAAQNDCDEDDDYDFNDDDIFTCTQNGIELALESCAWRMPVYNDTSIFASYFIDFEPDGNFVVYLAEDDLEYGGIWSVNEVVSNGFQITFTTNWTELNGVWDVFNCEDNALQLTNGIADILLAQDCNVVVDNPFICVNFLDIESCDYTGNGEANFNLYEAFGPELCSSNISRSFGFYTTLADAETQINEVANATSFNTSLATFYIRISITGSQDVYRIYSITLTITDCSTPCLEQNVRDYLVDCIWNITTFDGNNSLIGFDFNLAVDGSLFITDTATNIVSYGDWLVFSDPTTGRIILGFTNINNNSLSAIFGNSGLVSCALETLEFEKNGSGEIFIMEKDCG